jgi:uncharacterized protein with NRDE domain
MCVLFVAWKIRKDVPLIVAANRDEAYDRPTAPAAFWTECQGVLAGRDLRAGGTWMGASTSGRWAAVTNIRHPRWMSGSMPRSRGDLVARYLCDGVPPGTYGRRVAEKREQYAGFNLLVGDLDDLVYSAHPFAEARSLEPGFYGLSNGVLGDSWPKVARGGDAFRRWALGDLDEADGLKLLRDRRPAPEELLPDTGVGRELERVLSPLFIVTDGYGTRSSTLLAMHATGEGGYVEQSYGPGGAEGAIVRRALTIENVSDHEGRRIIRSPETYI